MKFIDLIIWILFILSLIVFIWFILGDSPTFEQTILIFSLTLLFTILSRTIKNEIKINILEKRFNHLAKDFIEYIKIKK